MAHPRSVLAAAAGAVLLLAGCAAPPQLPTADPSGPGQPGSPSGELSAASLCVAIPAAAYLPITGEGVQILAIDSSPESSVASYRCQFNAAASVELEFVVAPPYEEFRSALLGRLGEPLPVTSGTAELLDAAGALADTPIGWSITIVTETATPEQLVALIEAARAALPSAGTDDGFGEDDDFEDEFGDELG